MGWADGAIKKLQRGEAATIKPKGNSMRGKVDSGATVIVEPSDEYSKGDIVLVKVKGRVYLHLIKAIKDNRYQIGNNRGGINGWVSKSAIYGLATKID
jgi:phage repressor protein C with HTH and peptisase S24 domain